MKKLLPFILALVLLFSACSIEELEMPENEIAETGPDTSSFGVAYAPGESRDPYTTSNKLNAELMGLIAEPLFSVSETFEATPVLCTDYTYNDKTYTFNIKSGVTFSDGSSLTPDDVVFSLDAAREASSFYASSLSIIESVSSSNRNGTVTVRLKYDNARFPLLLDIPIIKKDTRGETLPVGTGLYAPNGDFTALNLRQNHHSGKSSRYQSIPLVSVASSDELLFEFDKHTVSIFTSDPTAPSPLTPLSASDIKNIPTTRMHFIAFNMKSDVFQDPAARLAVAKAIDRESIAKDDFVLMGTPSALPVHPSSNAYSSEIAETLSYDGNLSVSLSEPIEILVNSESSGKLAACKRIAEALTRNGAPCAVRSLPFNEYANALANGDFDLYYGEVSLGADFDLSRLLNAPLNYGAFSDATLLSLHASYLAGDEAREEFFEAFSETLPFVPIMFKNTAMYSRTGYFENTLPTSQNTYYRFSDWTVKE